MWARTSAARAARTATSSSSKLHAQHGRPDRASRATQASTLACRMRHRSCKFIYSPLTQASAFVQIYLTLPPRFASELKSKSRVWFRTTARKHCSFAAQRAANGGGQKQEQKEEKKENKRERRARVRAEGEQKKSAATGQNHALLRARVGPLFRAHRAPQPSPSRHRPTPRSRRRARPPARARPRQRGRSTDRWR